MLKNSGLPKKWTLKVKNRGKDISDSNSKKLKKIVYGQAALSLEFWSCKYCNTPAVVVKVLQYGKSVLFLNIDLLSNYFLTDDLVLT